MEIKGIIPRYCSVKKFIGFDIKFGSIKVGKVETAKLTKDKKYIEYTATIKDKMAIEFIKDGFYNCVELR